MAPSRDRSVTWLSPKGMRMNPFWNFVVAHQAVLTLGAFWVFSAAVGSLPPPNSASSPFYVWFYGFANSIAANIEQAARAKGIGKANAQASIDAAAQEKRP